MIVGGGSQPQGSRSGSPAPLFHDIKRRSPSIGEPLYDIAQVPMPKTPGPSCEYCPFAHLCKSACVFGWDQSLFDEVDLPNVAS